MGCGKTKKVEWYGMELEREKKGKSVQYWSPQRYLQEWMNMEGMGQVKTRFQVY